MPLETIKRTQTETNTHGLADTRAIAHNLSQRWCTNDRVFGPVALKYIYRVVAVQANLISCACTYCFPPTVK